MSKKEKNNQQTGHRLYRHMLPGGWIVEAGKTDSDNEHLSLKLAAPNDWWFHVRGMPGSHVILRVPKGGDPPDREALKLAASIAAYYSKARSGGIVPVSCTRARFISKSRGSKTGTVQIRKEIVFKVRPGLPVTE